MSGRLDDAVLPPLRRLQPVSSVRNILTALVLTGGSADLLSQEPRLNDSAWAHHVVCRYDFEHPVLNAPGWEEDRGFSGTAIELINGGGAQRAGEGAFPASSGSLETRRIDPSGAGNDDWKAGVYSADGIDTLERFGSARQITLMGWIKRRGGLPAPNSHTSSPDNTYNAIGLFGLLSGDSDGHAVRALIEVLKVGSDLRLVALGRRIDELVFLDRTLTPSEVAAQYTRYLHSVPRDAPRALAERKERIQNPTTSSAISPR